MPEEFEETMSKAMATYELLNNFYVSDLPASTKAFDELMKNLEGDHDNFSELRNSLEKNLLKTNNKKRLVLFKQQIEKKNEELDSLSPIKLVEVVKKAFDSKDSPRDVLKHSKAVFDVVYYLYQWNDCFMDDANRLIRQIPSQELVNMIKRESLSGYMKNIFENGYVEKEKITESDLNKLKILNMAYPDEKGRVFLTNKGVHTYSTKFYKTEE